MKSRLLSSSVLAFTLFVACGLFFAPKACAQYPANPDDAILKGRIPSSTIPASSLDFTQIKGNTGNVTVPVPLVTIGGESVVLEYYSQGVAGKVRTENQYAPSGEAGLGWQMLYGSISGEINGSADTFDDRYYYNGPDGSFQLQQGADSVFRIPNFKPWKFQRKVSSGGVILGWIVTKDDGTILRFGDYDKSTGQFLESYSPTYATRYYVGMDGLVANPPPGQYDSLQTIPFQWDLSNIQDVKGNQTTLVYQQVLTPLVTPGNGTSTVKYTRDSHLSQILDNKGQAANFYYATMNSNEYYNAFAPFEQNLLDSLYLDSVTVSGNGNVYRKIVFQYQSNSDILGLGIHKRYLTGISIQDGQGNALPSYTFAYCGLNGVQIGVNPGVLASVSDPDGGNVSYAYKTQALPNFQLFAKDTLKQINYWGVFGTRYNTIEGGLAGKDFVCVSKVIGSTSDSVRAYRRGATGWYWDKSCPISYRWQTAAGNDFIAAQGGMVAQLTKDGWKTYNAASLTASDCAVIGVGPNYFVVRYNEQNYYWDIAVVTITTVGLKAQQLPGTYYDYASPYSDGSYAPATRAYCGENYFVIVSYDENDPSAYFSHFADSSGTWKRLMNRGDSWRGANQSNTPFVKIGKNFVACGYTWPYDGSQGSGIADAKIYRHYGSHLIPLDSVTYNIGSAYTSFVLGDDYYAYTYQGSSHCEAVIRTWSGTQFATTSIIPNSSLLGMNLTTFGNRLMMSWSDATSKAGVLGYVTFTPLNQTWGSLVQLDSQSNSSGTWFWVPSGVSIDNGTIAELWEMEAPLVGGGFVGANPPNTPFIRAYQFRGDTVKSTNVSSLSLRTSEDPTHWVFQPGNGFLALSRSSQGTSASGPDSLQIFTFNQCTDGTMQFSGTDSATVVYQRTESNGMGNSSAYSFSFPNGVVNQFYTPDYGTVTESLPGDNGSTVTSYYTYKDSLVSGLNYKDLDGISYDTKDYTSQSSLVSETLSGWTAVGVDPANGVFDQELLSKTVTLDGVSDTTSYSYDDSTGDYLLNQETERNSDNTERITKLVHPLDYTVSSSATDTMAHALYLMQTANYIGPVINKRVIQHKNSTDTVVASQIEEYYSPQSGLIVPYKEMRWDSTSPAPIGNFQVPTVQGGTAFATGPSYIADETYESYTQYGQVVQSMDANGNRTTTYWGYGYEEPVAAVQNAKKSETDYLSFEDNSTGDWSLYTTGGSNIVSGTAHTGQKSWYISTAQFNGLYKTFQASDLDTTRSYILSAWVLTSSAYPRIWCKVVYNGGGSTTYPFSVTASGSGSWQQLDATVNLPSYSRLSSVTVYVLNNNGSSNAQCWFDDVRFCPTHSRMITQTFDLNSLVLTSRSGPNNNPTYYTYDSFLRPTTEQNYQYSVVKRYNYYVAGSSISSTNPDWTNTALYRSSTDSTTTRQYHDGLGRAIQTQTSGPSGQIVTDQVYNQLGSDSLIYKPFVYSTSSYISASNIESYDQSYYNSADGLSDSYPYSTDKYYADPLRRAENVVPPGSPWQSHPLSYSYGNNASAITIGSITYPQHSLYRTTTTDENGVKDVEYKDKFGNLVQAETDSGGLNLATNFAYDVLGNLTSSTSPKGYTTSYYYNTLGELTQKISPDAGTTQYLYDKNGNVRLIKDANHSGTANSLNADGILMGTDSNQGSFTLTLPGQVGIYLRNYGASSDIITGKIETTGGVVIISYQVSVSTGSGATSIYLPKGTYQYVATSTSDDKGNEFDYDFYCSNDYEMVYRKYDGLNRVTEEGEYQSSSSNGDFTQANAATSSFPTSNTLYWKKFCYDTLSTDSYASGQQNIMGRVSFTESWQYGSVARRTSYSYDAMGRVAWMVETGAAWYPKKLYYTYDLQGNVTEKEYYDFDWRTSPYFTAYTYDQAGRTSTLSTSPNSNMSGATQEASLQYFASGKPQQMVLGATPAATVKYRYNERDWLSVDTTLAYWEHLGYNTVSDVGTPTGASSQYNGNVSWISYYMDSVSYSTPYGPTKLVGYGFSYDHASRLTAAKFGAFYPNPSSTWYAVTPYSMPSISYDYNGNLWTLQRDSSGTTLVDNLSYKYRPGTDLDTLITNSAGAGSAYTYDPNGNIISDSRDGITFTIYDIDNQPVSVFLNSGTEYTLAYDVDGTRIWKNSGGGSYYVLYANGPDGKTEVADEVPYGENITINLWANGENIGQVRNNGGSVSHYYYLKGHLGDVKMILSSNGAPQAWNDYYPFGETMPGRSQFNAGPDTRYQLTSKERDVETGLYYFGARYYDSWRGQWLSVDPLAKKYPGWSPYTYTLDNPLRFIDEIGMGVQEAKRNVAIPTEQIINTVKNGLDAMSAASAVAGVGFGALALADPEPDSKVVTAAVSAASFTISGYTGVAADVGSVILAAGYHQGNLQSAVLKMAIDLGLTLSGEYTARKLDEVAHFTQLGVRSETTGRWISTSVGNNVQVAKATAGVTAFLLGKMDGIHSSAAHPENSSKTFSTEVDATSTTTEIKK